MNTTSNVPASASRIPAYTGNAREWAELLYAAGLTFNPEEDPAEIIDAQGRAMFTAAEVSYLSAILDGLTVSEVEDMIDEILIQYQRDEKAFGAREETDAVTFHCESRGAAEARVLASFPGADCGAGIYSSKA